MTTLAGVHLGLERYDRRRVDGLWMDTDSVDRMIEKLLRLGFRSSASPIPASAPTGPISCWPAAPSSRRSAASGRRERLRVADRGLREGILTRTDGRRRGLARAAGDAERGHDQEAGGKPGATRVAATRKIKKKSGLKESSRRWLERHMNDPYVQRSKADGYRSRAAYKLIEIDDRYKLLKPGMSVDRPGRGARRLVPGGGRADALDRRQAACRRHRLSRHGSGRRARPS